MPQDPKIGRDVLPIPDRPHIGLTTYDAKDPDTSFPPIVPLRPPEGAPNVLIVLLDDVGFGAASADVPHALRQAILMLVTHWFEHRSAITIGEAPVATPQGVHALIAPYRRMSLC